MFSIVSASIIVENKVRTLCDRFSRYSFAIYVISLPVQNVVNIICVKSQVDAIIIWIAMFVLGIIIPFVIAKIIELIESRSTHKPLSIIIGM